MDFSDLSSSHTSYGSRSALPLSTTSAFATPTSYIAEHVSFDDIVGPRPTFVRDAAKFNASDILARHQQYQIQVIASTFSSVSIFAAILAIYWFCMMRRNFRRDLVLLLICGDLWKSCWFLVFSVRTLADGHVSTDAVFCQASGYFLQLGFEACDIAIFLMSLHMSLQIFPPKDSFLGHDGLYRVRNGVYATWFIVPNIIASLAFINPHDAYISQGGFCSLPIRPIWYRLALSWIPRYLIWIYIMWVAIRIYLHVGYEFKVFGEERDRSSSMRMDSSSANEQTTEQTTQNGASMRREQSSNSDAAAAERQAGLDDTIAPEDAILPAPTDHQLPGPSKQAIWNSARRQSTPAWSTPFEASGIAHMESLHAGNSPKSKSTPTSRRGSKQIGSGVTAEDFAPPTPPLPAPFDHHPRGSVSTIGSIKSAGPHSSFEHSPQLSPIKEQRSGPLKRSNTDNVATQALKRRRKAIQRQLRLLFIYPVVYIILWVVPFVSHAMNYSDHFAQHPIFAIGAISIFCQTFLGTCDVLVFSWREKPWRHIPGSDGTFWGSFAFWKVLFNKTWLAQRRRSSAPSGMGGEGEKRKSSSSSGLLNSIKRFSVSLSGKGNSPKRSELSLSRPAPDPTCPITPSRTNRSAAPPMHRRMHSGGSDRRVLAAERAQERLEMERREYQQNRRSLNERRESIINPQEGVAAISPAKTATPRKEWWDRHMSLGGDDEVHEDEKK